MEIMDSRKSGYTLSHSLLNALGWGGRTLTKPPLPGLWLTRTSNLPLEGSKTMSHATEPH